MRPTSCEIELDAIAGNVRVLRALVDPTPLCAVVKANAYGHGAVEVARTALDAGAAWLAVALVEEGVELRSAGITSPILLLSEPPLDAMATVVEHGLVPSLYSVAAIDAMAGAARDRGPLAVQLVVDTGMGRVGVGADDVSVLVDAIAETQDLILDGVWTHCPVADELGNDFTDEQLARFDQLMGQPELVHLPHHFANSAAAITRPQASASMVRTGIAMYGLDPSPELAGMVELEPAMRLVSAVSFVKRVGPGDSVGYGRRWTAEHATTVATVPIGYADGVRRDLGLCGGGVLIGGRWHPIRGVVTMDQLMVDVGDATVDVGDEVVIVGSQGDETIGAGDIAELLDTISYEVVCAVSDRVPRIYR